MSEIILGKFEILPATIKNLTTKIDLTNDSKPYSEDCGLKANNDFEAIKEWLEQYKSVNV